MSEINQLLLEQLEQIEKKKLAMANLNAIQIQEIIVCEQNRGPHYFRHGEFEQDDDTINTETEEAFIIRLVTHLQDLADEAQTTHDLRTSPPTDRNYLTRLLLTEAALYPGKKRGALSLEGLNKLVDSLDIVTSGYSDDIHLLFASLPVLVSENQILNVALYIQCGKEPVFHIFAKAHADDDFDPIYPNTHLAKANKINKIQYPALATSAKDQANVGININYSCIAISETSAGSAFCTGIDICADSGEQVAKYRMKSMLNSARSKGNTTLLPTKASYIQTSNYAFFGKESALGESASHADPKYSYEEAIKKGSTALFNSSNITICTIDKPKFGNPLVLYVYPPRELSPCYGELDAQISQHNKIMVKLNALRQYRSQRILQTDLVHIEVIKTILVFFNEELGNLSVSKEIKEQFANISPHFPDNIDNLLEQLARVKDSVSTNEQATKIIGFAISLIMQDQIDNALLKENHPSLPFEKTRSVRTCK